MLRFLPIALLGMMMPGQAMAQREMMVPDDGTEAPAVRPCIDYAGRGMLRTIGKPVTAHSRPPILVGTPRHVTIVAEAEDRTETTVSSGVWDSIYRFRFDERAAVFGQRKGQGTTLTKSYHSLGKVQGVDAVVFTAARDNHDRMVDWEWVWRDERGRPFLPILSWPEPVNDGSDWRPLAIRQLAGPVRYSGDQPHWPGALHPGDAEREPDLFAMQGKRVVVRYGLYLSDIPAMFAAAKNEDCWR
jgi:hypothetical protein